MAWKMILDGVNTAASLGGTIAGAVNSAKANEQQQKALDEQKKQNELAQKNLKDSQARQDKAEQNAINASSDFMKKDKEDEQEESDLSGSLNNSFASYIPHMEQE